MILSCGIVGLPNVGKSTLFNALTRSELAKVGDYPFCTINPNIAPLSVPDARLKVLSEMHDGTKIIPSSIEVRDIAGLIEGASKGLGQGNQFLSEIKCVDAIAHMVRCFESEKSGTLDPVRDIRIVESELILSDLDQAQKRVLFLTKDVKKGNKDAQKKIDALNLFIEHLDKSSSLTKFEFQDEFQYKAIKEIQPLTIKPMVYIGGLDETSDEETDISFKTLAEFAKSKGIPCLPIRTKLASESTKMSDEEKSLLENEFGIKADDKETQDIVATMYSVCDAQVYFTAGEKEVHSWTVKKGCSAKQAAGAIHTDFETGFIKAEIISYEDYISCEGRQNARDAGKLRVEGKDYIVKDGDVIEFKFSKR